MKNTDFDTLLENFSAIEILPESFREDAKKYYWPLSRNLAEKINNKKIKVIGVSGSQGSGKSTLAKLLREIFEEIDGFRAVDLSIDDFYLTRKEREKLSNDIHPLLLSRGVPGTHDVALAIKTISSLLSLKPKTTHIPRFDKSIDDRKPEAEWEAVSSPVDVVILEGWCVSIPPQDPAELIEPINQLEQDEDPDQLWRNFVNNSLAKKYADLFNLIDYTIFLESPSFETVYEWRTLQENKLAASLSLSNSTDTTKKLMDANQLRQFIQHFERLTRHGLKTLPSVSDIVFCLGDDHRIHRQFESTNDINHRKK